MNKAIMTKAMVLRRHREPMTTRTIRTFFIAAFAVSWGRGYSSVPTQAGALFGPMGYTNRGSSTPPESLTPIVAQARGHEAAWAVTGPIEVTGPIDWSSW